MLTGAEQTKFFSEAETENAAGAARAHGAALAALEESFRL